MDEELFGNTNTRRNFLLQAMMFIDIVIFELFDLKSFAGVKSLSKQSL